jgi:hypothetical protein
MVSRRRLIVGSLSALLAARTSAAPSSPETANAEIDQLGKLDVVIKTAQWS